MMRVLLRRGSGAGGQRGKLEEGESHHLRVRRAREGEVVDLRDGFGLAGTGRLVRQSGEWEVEVESADRLPRPAELTLAVGAGDRERFAWVVEKGVELGVTKVVPLETERTAGVATRVRSRHLEKLRRGALESLKQCGTWWVCEVAEPVELAAFADRTPDGSGWLADPAGPAPPAVLDGSPLSIVVGPEGGLTGGERLRLEAAGYRRVALGPHTLRFETAALAAAALASAARLRGSHG